MPINVQDLPAREVNVLNKNTGFPEPLSPDRNTTLPHPDADTSPNASIEAPDTADLTRPHSRTSFLHRRQKSSKGSFGRGGGSVTSFGSFASGDMKESGLYDNIQYADGTHEGKNGRALDAGRDSGVAMEPVGEENRSVNGTAQTNGVKNMNGDGEAEVKLVENRDEQGYLEGERKKGVLRKLNLHKV